MSVSTPPTSPRLLPTDAAKHLGLSKSYLSILRRAGGGPAFYQIGRKVEYAIADLDAWLAQKRRATTPAERRRSIGAGRAAQQQHAEA